MQLCLALALKGKGKVAPNPIVGCVIVCDEQVIGSGYHTQFGASHAEVEAIHSVKNQSVLDRSTLFVNLEPCAHFGKTPPCANLIIEHKIPKVVIACKDPNPLVAGKGIALLEQAGIEVVTGVLEAEAEALNVRFLKAYSQHIPYTILKWAESKDGFMGNDTDRYISGEEAQKTLHAWRAQEQAFMVGSNTLIQDNPRLSNRLHPGPQPVRIALDWHLKSADKQLHFYDQSQKTIVLNGIVNKVDQNIEWIKLADKHPLSILKTLYERGIYDLVIEGGAQLLQSFYSEKCYHEIRVITSKTMALGYGIKGPSISEKPQSSIELEQDIIHYY